MNNLETARNNMIESLRSAYSLLPPSFLVSHAKIKESSRLEQVFNHEDWDQFLILLQNYRKEFDFPSDLLDAISTAENYARLHEHLGLENMQSEMLPRELEVIGECLNATVYGSFFPDWEFSTLFGMQREDVAQVATQWPDIDTHNEFVGPAINNSINWLLFYPHKKYHEWSKYISVSPKECHEIYQKWRSLVGRKDNRSTGKEEFFRNLE